MTYHKTSTTQSEKCGLLHCYADLLRTPQIKKVRMRTYAAKNGPIWEPWDLKVEINWQIRRTMLVH